MKSPQAQLETLAAGQGKGCVVSEIDSSCLTIPGQRDDNRQLTRELSCPAIHSPLHPLYSRAGQKGRETRITESQEESQSGYGEICPWWVLMERD